MTTQGHVSETLRRAVAGGRVAHAYLFCGPRGVGKTSIARVLAMALNCPRRSEAGEPCGRCETCDRIWGGHTALDVVEIDAASNRGVDDARELRERAMYAPSEEGRHKVYIVDEAHMLTREAWNALLKILEEPPPRVVFIFATTEPHKIQQSASPILSRCQRFDFRRIGVADLVDRLRVVLEREGAAAPEEALRVIARKADGGMRDALSLLDQVLALTGGEVDVEAVRRVLGLVDEERYIELLDVVAERRHGDVFGFVERLLDEGYDLVEFHHGLLETLRKLLRLRLAPDSAQDALDVREDLREAFAARAAGFEPADLVRMLAAAAELERDGSLRRSANPRVLVEMLLLRMSYLDRTVALEELIRALGGAPPSDGGTEGGTGGWEAGPAARRGASTGSAGAEEASPSTSAHGTSSVSEAWMRWLDSGVRVPAGLSALLRSAEVREGPDGSIEVAAGPAAERLADPRVLREVRAGLAPHLGRDPHVVVAGSEGGGTEARISLDEVREDTMKSLCRKEPRLPRAVQELDLELME